MVVSLIFTSFLGLFFHQTKGLKLRYFFNKNLNNEYISHSKHFVTSKIINNKSCNELCKKITGKKKSILLFGDSHAGDFEFELTKILEKKKINLNISYNNRNIIDPLNHLHKILEIEKSDYVFLVFHRKEKDNNIFYDKLKLLLNTYPQIKFYYFLQRLEFDQAPIKFKILNKSFDKINIMTFRDLNKFKVPNFQILEVINR